jgi:hypothetical protein
MPLLDSHHDAFAAVMEPSPRFALRTGRVLRQGGGPDAVVLVEGDERTLRCAVSCLLVPEPGDLVLVADNSNGAYVLAVLERPGGAPAILTAKTPSDTMVLSAKNLAVRADEDIEIAAPQTHVRGERFTIAVEALSFIARLLTQTLGRWQTSAQKIDMVATDIATKAAQRVTIIDETDMLQAGAILQKVDSATVTNAKAVVITADEDLRLDGTRVTVG